MEEGKRQLVRSWLRKAHHDLAAARLLSGTETELADIAVYHCQQAAEKALKGLLVFHDQRAPKTHDVGLLVELAVNVESRTEALRDPADRLTPFATAYRYPSTIDLPLAAELEQALEDAQTVFQQVVSFLPPEVDPSEAGEG
jgi:HEPN domain-containing protein